MFDSHKDFGIIISQDMSWDKHYGLLISEAYGQLSLIRLTFSLCIPVKTKKVLYLSLISQFVQGSQLWRPMYLKDIKSMEDVQRRATKYIICNFTSDYKSRLITLELHPLTMFILNEKHYVVQF